MDWIKKRYDRFTLLLAAIILLAMAAFVYLRTGSFGQQFELQTGNPNAQPPTKDTEALNAALNQLQQPTPWEAREEADPSLFRAKTHLVLPDENKLVKVDPESDITIYDPITLRWILKYDLPLEDDRLPRMDPDDDDFTNQEEFLAETDPTDPASHPPYTRRLFVKEVISNPDFFTFAAKPAADTFQINREGRRSQFVQTGSIIEGSAWKLIEYTEKMTERPGRAPLDESELTLENTVTSETATLVKGKRTNLGDFTVVLEYLWKGDQEFRLKEDGTFNLPPDNDSFVVQEIQQDPPLAKVQRQDESGNPQGEVLSIREQQPGDMPERLSGSADEGGEGEFPEGDGTAEG